MIEMTIRDGLGARVTTMANGLSTGQEVAFGWAVNEHCPLAHEVVFPKGIAGVVFTEPMGDGGFTDWNAKPYFSWDGADDRDLANAAYSRIMAAMTGTPFKVPMAILGRFWRNPQGRWETVADYAIQTANEAGADQVFLLADKHRWEMRCRLIAGGLDVRIPYSFPLTSDLSREPDDTLAFLSDWQTLCDTPLIVAIDGPSCLLNPARAAGREIRYCAGPARGLQAGCKRPKFF